MWCCPSCRKIARFPSAGEVWPPGWKCSECGYSVPKQNGIPNLCPKGASEPRSFDAKLFNALVQVEETNFWFVNRASLIVALLRKYSNGAASLLEIGCGPGSVLLAIGRAFPQLSLTGSELLPEGLELAQRRLGKSVSLLQMDASFVPAKDEFDVVCAFDVLEHIRDDENAIAQIFAALKPGGTTLISVPQHRWLWSPLDDVVCHQRRYSRIDLEAKLSKAGFKILYSSSFNVLLLPLMMLSRIVMIAKARLGSKLEPSPELQVAPWFNQILSAVLKLEVALSNNGMRWPVGGSRFVVAQKS